MGKPFKDSEIQNAGKTQTPTAPPFEKPSNVNFVILGNQENYNVRADRLSILNSNTDLARIVKLSADECKCIINQRNIDAGNFEKMIRFVETNFIRFNDDVRNTLNILEIASTFQCHALEIACVKELDLKLDVANVIDIFKALRYYNINTVQKIKLPLKPVAAEEFLCAMFSNTLQFIDQYAAEILTRTEMFELRFEEMEIISKREALQISSETFIFNLIADWSAKDCERKVIESNEENRRRVLGALIYTPRYLAMTSDEFKKCRNRVSLLDPAEIKLIEMHFAGKKNTNLTEEQNLMMQNFKRPRPEFAEMPINLSTRSDPKNYSKKMRKFSQKKADEVEGKSCCDVALLNCISIFACIFE